MVIRANMRGITDVVNPFQLFAVKFPRASKQRLGFQGAPATTPIRCQPAIDRRTIDAHNTSHNLWIFAVLNTAHRALTHGLQCSVVQLSRVVFPHDSRESYSPDPVKAVYLLMYSLNKHYRAIGG